MRPRSCWTNWRARAAFSVPPSGSSASSAPTAVTTPRLPRPTSLAARWARRCAGLRPVPEVQFFDYIWTAMQQIKSEAATVRWRSAGEWSCPMVLRVPIGGYLAGGAIWHSQSGVSIFAHVPGLVIVMPSRAVDAVGLLRTALSGEDPVMFLEHKHLLRQRYTEGAFPAKGFRLPFGKGRIAQAGNELTIVTYGATVERSLRAARCHWGQRRGDRPALDHALGHGPGRRVRRSHRAPPGGLRGQPDVRFWRRSGGLGERALLRRPDAPVTRIGAADTHVAYEPTLERATLPQTEQIEAAAGASFPSDNSDRSDLPGPTRSPNTTRSGREWHVSRAISCASSWSWQQRGPLWRRPLVRSGIPVTASSKTSRRRARCRCRTWSPARRSRR